MKFDIYNKATWDDVPIVTKVDNRAVGAIGQKIGELKAIKSKLIGANCEKFSKDYEIALELKASSAQAYNEMDISIHYQDDVLASAMADIDFILNSWENVSSRVYSWRNLIPYFERLKPFLAGNGMYDVIPSVESLLEIKVHGNAAWQAYLNVVKTNRANRDTCNELSNKYRRLLESMCSDSNEDEDDDV